MNTAFARAVTNFALVLPVSFFPSRARATAGGKFFGRGKGVGSGDSCLRCVTLFSWLTHLEGSGLDSSLTKCRAFGSEFSLLISISAYVRKEMNSS